tara:strand:- start:2234 stop:2866 length:633 start_codon:yes stop_codon:yes gene_type:complete
MYVPEQFTVTNRPTQIEFIRKTGWGLLTGIIDSVPFVTHLPFLVDGAPGNEKLVSHMARANPHWESFTSGKSQLVVFSGPHTYISPSWYNSDKVVPTWNYTTAHVYGTPIVIDDPTTVYSSQLDLVKHHEAQYEKPWQMESLDDEFANGMLKAIVSFEIPIEQIQCKFKISQNRPAEDQISVIDALNASTDVHATEIASLMKAQLSESAD